MRDPRLDRLADVLVRYSAGIKRGDLVVISGDPGAMESVEAVFTAVLNAGGHPSFRPVSENLRELLLRHGSDEQIRHLCPFNAHQLENCDVLMVLRHPVNSRYLGRVDPVKAAMANAARQARLSSGLKKLASGKQRYVLTEISSHSAAQDAEMSLTDYADWVYRAGLLHLEDPVASWRQLHEQQARACSYLRSNRVLRFTAPADGHDGTDVSVDVTGRSWVNCAGDQNFPDGEIFSGPVGVDGVVNFTFPAIYQGKQVDGIRLVFKAGRVTEASATKNEAYLVALLDQDQGSRVAGELGIGTNYQLTDFINNTFLDEKIGGTFHLALGAGYPQTGNANESGVHWDIVTDLRRGGAIYADGELIQENGKFLLPGWPGCDDDDGRVAD